MRAPSDIGRRLRLARQEAGLSQQQLGNLLDPPRSHAAVSDMERGVTRVSAEDIRQLSDLLRKPTAYFYGDQSGASTARALYGRGDAGGSPAAKEAVERFRQYVRAESERRKRGRK